MNFKLLYQSERNIFFMEINFIGTRIPVNNADIRVWDKKVKYVQAIVKDETEADESFWENQFIPNMHKAVEILGNNSDEINKTASKEMGEEINIRSLNTLAVNFSGDKVCYDYYFNAGKIYNSFSIHIKGFPDGSLEFAGIS